MVIPKKSAAASVCSSCQYKSRKTHREPDSDCFNICFHLLNCSVNLGWKLKPTARSIVTLWEPVLARWRTQTQKHSHRRGQRTCRGVSLLVPCRLGGGSWSWLTKSWRLPKARGTVSIVRWALFSRYNHSAELWKHCLNPNRPWDWRDFSYFLNDK